MKKSKNIVVTGVSTGIGYTTVQALVKRGYRVFGSVRKQVDADRLKKEFGDLFEPLLFDVTDMEAVKSEAARVEQLIGSEGIHSLINNAGIAVWGPMMHVPLEDLRWQLEVNVVGLVGITQAFLPLLGAKENCPHAAGRVFNISSAAGEIANAFMGPYSASKHALEAISKTMRMEFMLYGIDVVVIGPGVVKTPIWDKAEEVDLNKFAGTGYEKSGAKFKKFMMKISKEGYEQAEFGEMMANIIEAKKPKARYPLVYGKFKNWTVPRLMPTRKLASIIGKVLGFTK
jgi:NAD(P)-dependent dehydrogenase (short-subunit alcohol dehydrogenase family)